MSVGALFWRSRRGYVLISVVFALLAWIGCVRFGWHGAGYALTAFATVLLRDIGYCIRSARAWPLLQRAIDWDAVEALMEEDGANTPKA